MPTSNKNNDIIVLIRIPWLTGKSSDPNSSLLKGPLFTGERRTKLSTLWLLPFMNSSINKASYQLVRPLISSGNVFYMRQRCCVDY